MRRVVDTNVAILANGQCVGIRPACQLAALQALRRLLEDGTIVIDIAGAILSEYRRYLQPKGQPGVGDRFFREILMNYGGRVDRVELPTNTDGSYMDFPIDERLRAFDPSDRKFAAAARRGEALVMNAIDTDWLYFRSALAENGILVDFICGCNQSEWFSERSI